MLIPVRSSVTRLSDGEGDVVFEQIASHTVLQKELSKGTKVLLYVVVWNKAVKNLSLENVNLKNITEFSIIPRSCCFLTGNFTAILTSNTGPK